MTHFKFTLIDDAVRRVSNYSGHTGLLATAARNPKSVDEFIKVHKEISGYDLYLQHLIDEEVLMNTSLTHIETIAYGVPYIGDRGTMTLKELLTLSQQPDYKDFKPNENVGTSLKNYDGVIVVDLRKNELGLKGWERKYDGKKIPGDPTEPFYEWFGFISLLRSGNANFGPGKDVRYALDDSWTLKDLTAKRTYKS